MEYEAWIQNIKKMMDAGILIDPLLVNTYSQAVFGRVYEQASAMTDSLFQRFTHYERMRSLEDTPFSLNLAQNGLLETLLSTAMSIMHEHTGNVIPTPAVLLEAHRRVSAFLSQYGLDTLYRLYYWVIGHDILQPFYYHKELAEAEYLQARRHHPYRPGSLDMVLILGLARGMFRIRQREDERVVAITRRGLKTYELLHQVFVDSGYIAKRVMMSYVYQFDRAENFDDLFNAVFPETPRQRREYIEWLGDLDGTHVLEVACGTGALTFDSGLYEAVGRLGMLTATDISQGMLDQAARKWRQLGSPPQVVLQQASVENLPFADAVFDVCCGSYFIHFVDGAKALAEMRRVVRPGGLISIYQGLQVDLNRPFFREWFAPLLELSRGRSHHRPANYLPTLERLHQYFAGAGLHSLEIEHVNTPLCFEDSERVVQFLVRGVSYFQVELMELPWDDRRAVISELVDRGEDVCRKYPISERIIEFPAVWLKAVRPQM
ncbi:MAG: methyltransferase domain-containing protein [Alicyclobacillus herbarius]|uniref:class I SAM-dependent methyltransferase n=1 Tax=Alicyclobacillus herbarius TaxID=122960 RepID=UPI002353E628|nr:methyltransferase domain-containing protein [Alicyclobacillus herbarius]MCL6631018.1 methyltransferase domain-containing protein [Alicyclobacillus herbarius]